jgi:hypothetical protein
MKNRKPKKHLNIEKLSRKYHNSFDEMSYLRTLKNKNKIKYLEERYEEEFLNGI